MVYRMIDYFELILTFLKRLLDKLLRQDIPSYQWKGAHTAYTAVLRDKYYRQKAGYYASPRTLPDDNPVVFSPPAGLFI